ncbi:MAG: sigma-70 family RNA polymerase sigma factor [Pseudomonadota bacterium]
MAILRQSGDTESLIRRCNQGDRQAWDEFYASYAGMINAAVGKFTWIGADEREDVVQDVFLKLIDALKTYDPSMPLAAYILEIARRVRISGLRQATALKRGGKNPGTVSLNTHDSGDPDQGVSVPSKLDDPETLLSKARETQKLRFALSRISSACRALLELRYDRNLSYSEIAEQMGAREGTLRVRVQRCLSDLAKRFSDNAPEEAVES